ncbi:unnamed protein product [Linum trigynum]|uniref:Uncharacterized protein n=1 Tax=Linum trigynum TaxID=586398 RepID=A0AAV2DIX2_9ROSI
MSRICSGSLIRGNQVVTVNKQPVQIFWDVHDWLYNGGGGGSINGNGGGSQGLFTFKPGAPEMEWKRMSAIVLTGTAIAIRSCLKIKQCVESMMTSNGKLFYFVIGV